MSSRLLCPACQHQPQQLIDPDCIVCDGIGVLYLGDPALTLYPVEVVAEAVELTLEEAGAMDDTGERPTADRVAAVHDAMLALRDSGVLDAATTTLRNATAAGSPWARLIYPHQLTYRITEPDPAVRPFRVSNAIGPRIYCERPTSPPAAEAPQHALEATRQPALAGAAA